MIHVHVYVYVFVYEYMCNVLCVMCAPLGSLIPGDEIYHNIGASPEPSVGKS